MHLRRAINHILESLMVSLSMSVKKIFSLSVLLPSLFSTWITFVTSIHTRAPIITVDTGYLNMEKWKRDSGDSVDYHAGG